MTATRINTEARPNAGSITPVTAGALPIIIGAAAAAAAGVGTAFTQPADLSSATNHFRSGTINETHDGILGFGFKSDWASGAFDPGQWSLGGGSGVSTDTWCAATLALRPA